MKTCSECKYFDNGICLSDDRLNAVVFAGIRGPEAFGCTFYEQTRFCPNKVTRPVTISAETEQEKIMLEMMRKYQDRLKITSMEYNGLWASFTLSIQDEGDE